MASRSETSTPSSNDSSIVQGIGYGLGSAALWVGMKMMDAFGELEIRRRRWAIRRVMKTMERITDKERAGWILRNQRQIDRVVVDLLKLSSYVFITFDHIACIPILSVRNLYKLRYCPKARGQGTSLRKLLTSSPISDVGPTSKNTYAC